MWPSSVVYCSGCICTSYVLLADSDYQVLVLLLSAGPIWWQVTARDRSWPPIVFCCCSIDDNDEPSLWLKTHEGHFQLWENMPRLSFHESSTEFLSVNDLKLCNSAHPSFWFQRCESTCLSVKFLFASFPNMMPFDIRALKMIWKMFCWQHCCCRSITTMLLRPSHIAWPLLPVWDKR